MTPFSRTGIALTVVLVTIGCSQPAATPEMADTIFYGGDILTMNGDQPTYAEAVAVKGGKITFVGSKADAFTLKGADTKTEDLDSATMLPGFLDPHSHFMSAIMMVNQVNVAAPPVGTSTNIAQIIEKLKAFQHENDIPLRSRRSNWTN